MKLFYQSMGVARRSTTGFYGQSLKELLARSAAPGTTVDVYGLSEGAAIADQYRYLEIIDTREILENGLRAEKEGYDAFLIGNIFEPGLHALREVLNIPVLGLCEASIHLACMMGAGFSIVNVNPKFVRKVTENIAGAGLSSRLISIEHMQVERGAVLDRAFEDDSVRQMVVDQFSTAARAGIARGAEVVIPAGGIVMSILAKSGVHVVDRAPVVNGVIGLLKMAEMAVQMKQLTGFFTSKTMMYAPPTGALLRDIRKSYGADLYPGAV
ncbi:MAG: allantoin racemase [Acetobacteraceae bacterium]|jgi:allantoin racemase|nr:allantoin racemase [Acetobacteraceae bacterium]